MVGTYVLLDLVPKGRDEDELPFAMQWVRHHDRYDVGNAGRAFADPDQPYWPKVAPAEGSRPEVATVEASPSCCGTGRSQ